MNKLSHIPLNLAILSLEFIESEAINKSDAPKLTTDVIEEMANLDELGILKASSMQIQSEAMQNDTSDQLEKFVLNEMVNEIVEEEEVVEEEFDLETKASMYSMFLTEKVAVGIASAITIGHWLNIHGYTLEGVKAQKKEANNE